MKTPNILLPALRQYRHNNKDSFVHGYDKDETDKIVSELLKQIHDKYSKNIMWDVTFTNLGNKL